MSKTKCILQIICALHFTMIVPASAQTTGPASPLATNGATINFGAFTSPILFKGDAVTAYRDPAAVYHKGEFHLYFTLVKTEPDGKIFSYTAWSKSANLAHWTEPRIFTPRDHGLNFCAPGNIIRFRDQWVLCLQTYPRPKGEKYGNRDCRVWIMRSNDLENWGPPERLMVKGPEVPVEKMGRLIDPYFGRGQGQARQVVVFFRRQRREHVLLRRPQNMDLLQPHPQWREPVRARRKRSTCCSTHRTTVSGSSVRATSATGATTACSRLARRIGPGRRDV